MALLRLNDMDLKMSTCMIMHVNLSPTSEPNLKNVQRCPYLSWADLEAALDISWSKIEPLDIGLRPRT